MHLLECSQTISQAKQIQNFTLQGYLTHHSMNRNVERVNINTVVVGGGQAGLATSYYLKQNQIDHIVLERADKPAYSWREQKWDSFCFVTPNWMITLPGLTWEDMGFTHDDFLLRDDIVTYFEQYITKNQPPLEFNSNVQTIKQQGNYWILTTPEKEYLCKNVVVATGFFQTPKKPKFAPLIDDGIFQIHSSEYKNPQQLKEGAVLVVGSGQSGMQIAEELYKSGRKVHLALGKTGRVPRRYRGKDTTEWMDIAGIMTRDVESLSTLEERRNSNPHVSGANGGHDLNIHQFFKDGVSIYGRLNGVSNGFIFHFEPDLIDLINLIENFENEFLDAIDNYISENEEVSDPPTRNTMDDANNQEIISELDSKEKGIANIIWATGYNRDYSFIEVEGELLDYMRFPIQKSGVTNYAGLYFIGLPWLTTSSSGLVYGVGHDAKSMVYHLMNRM